MFALIVLFALIMLFPALQWHVQRLSSPSLQPWDLCTRSNPPLFCLPPCAIKRRRLKEVAQMFCHSWWPSYNFEEQYAWTGHIFLYSYPGILTLREEMFYLQSVVFFEKVGQLLAFCVLSWSYHVDEDSQSVFKPFTLFQLDDMTTIYNYSAISSNILCSICTFPVR